MADALDFNEQADWVAEEGIAFHMLALTHGFGSEMIVGKSGVERVTPANTRELLAGLGHESEPSLELGQAKEAFNQDEGRNT